MGAAVSELLLVAGWCVEDIPEDGELFDVNLSGGGTESPASLLFGTKADFEGFFGVRRISGAGGSGDFEGAGGRTGSRGWDTFPEDRAVDGSGDAAVEV